MQGLALDDGKELDYLMKHVELIILDIVFCSKDDIYGKSM